MNNDQIILEQILNQRRTEVASALSMDDFLEIVIAEYALKEFDVTYEEIDSGIVDGGGDGGVDGVYTFINGELVTDETDTSVYKKDVSLDLVILQSKNTGTFSSTALDKVLVTLQATLDLARTETELRQLGLNDSVIDAFNLFSTAYQQTAPTFPKTRIRFVYATKGVEIHPTVTAKANELAAVLRRLFGGAEVQTELWGAVELVKLARERNENTIPLKLAETPVSTGGEGFVCLVRLPDYYNFLSDPSGSLRSGLFESNVRDYQGNRDVNRQIQATLQQATDEDFWWLNNGITIVAEKASHSGKTLTLKAPQIVNGLQTSHEIHGFFAQFGGKPDDGRHLLVRVVVAETPASVDRIIKATNSQNAISQTSLRATEKIQRDIEDYLLSKGLFYDRRRNHYKNNGKALTRIVSPKLLAQVVHAVKNQKPNESRSAPSALMSQETYKSIFEGDPPIQLFANCITMFRELEAHLRTLENVEARVRRYLRFHVAMVVAAMLCRSASPSKNELSKMISLPSRDQVVSAFKFVYGHYVQLGNNDRVAKSKSLTENLVEQMPAFLE